MRILDNGLVEITNRSTGEVRVVTPQELPNYGIPYSKYQTELNAFNEILQGGKKSTKELSDTQSTSLADFDAAIKIIGDLGKKITSGKDLFGPVSGNIGRIDPSNIKAQKLNSEIRGAVQLVGKAMEGGVLRKEDEAKYRAILPSIGDTPETAMEKVKSVSELLNTQKEAKVSGFLQLGYKIPDQYLKRGETPILSAPTSVDTSGLPISSPSGMSVIDRLKRAEGARVGAAREMGENKASALTEKAADVQKFLGESETLPILYGILGKGLTRAMPVQGLGSGVGAGVGEWQKQWLQQGGLSGAIPKDAKAIGKTAATTGLLDFLFSNPMKQLGNIQGKIATNVPTTASGERIAQQIMDRVTKDVPLSQRKTVEKLVLDRVIPEFSGKQFSIPELLNLKNKAWNVGFTAAEKAGRGATATFERMVGTALKDELARVAPAVSNIDKVLSVGHKTGNVGKLVTRAIPATILSALGIKSLNR